jgi:hypothetical protein
MSEIPGYVKMTAITIREKSYEKWQNEKNEYEEWKKTATLFLLNWRKTKSKLYCIWHGVPNEAEKLCQWKLNYVHLFVDSIKIDGFPEPPKHGFCARDWYYRTKNLADSTEVFINVDDARQIFR